MTERCGQKLIPLREIVVKVQTFYHSNLTKNIEIFYSYWSPDCSENRYNTRQLIPKHVQDKNVGFTKPPQPRKPSIPISYTFAFPSSNSPGQKGLRTRRPPSHFHRHFALIQRATNVIENTKRKPKGTANGYLKNMIRSVYSEIDKYNPEYSVHSFIRPPRSLLRLPELQLRHYI